MQYAPRSDTPGHVTTVALYGGLWAISSTQAWPNHPMIPIFPRSDSLASPFNLFISSGAPDVVRAKEDSKCEGVSLIGSGLNGPTSS